MSAATLQGARYSDRAPDVLVGLSVYDAEGRRIVVTSDLGINAYAATELAAHLIGRDAQGILAAIGERVPGIGERCELDEIGGVAVSVYVEQGSIDESDGPDAGSWLDTLDTLAVVRAKS